MTLPQRSAIKRGLSTLVLAGAASVSAVGLVHAALNARDYWTGWVGIVVWYVVPSIVLVLLLVVMRGEARRRARVSLCLVSVAVSLFAVEVFEGVRSRGGTYVAKARSAGISFDERSQVEVALDLRLQGVDAVPNFRAWPEDFTTDLGLFPLGGPAGRLTVLPNENGEHPVFHSDVHGFNNPASVWRNGGPFSVAVLGDSFVHGAGVPPNSDLTSRIRSVYPKTVNLGHSGNGPILELATLFEYVEPLRPQIVLWCFFEGNDVQDFNAEKQKTYLRNMDFVDPLGRQNLIERQDDLEEYYRKAIAEWFLKAQSTREAVARDNAPVSRTEWLFRLVRLSHLRTRLKRLTSHYSAPTLRSFSLDEELLAEVLVAARDGVSSWQGQLYFVYLPEWSRYTLLGQPNKHRATILRIVRDLEIPVIDLHHAFLSHGDPLAMFPFRLSGHYSATGHEVAATAILGQLSRLDLEQ